MARNSINYGSALTPHLFYLVLPVVDSFGPWHNYSTKLNEKSDAGSEDSQFGPRDVC